MNPSISAPASGWKKQWIVLACLLATRAIGTYAIPDDIGEGKKSAISLALPDQLGQWTGREVKVDPVVYEVLQPDAVLQKRFHLAAPTSGALAPDSSAPDSSTPNSSAPDSSAPNAPSPQVEVLVVYSRDPKGLHSPVTCLRAQGWTIGDESQRVAQSGGKSLTLQILSGQQRERRTQLAYCFTDAGEAVTGRIATFARMMLARVMRRRVGAVEMQFAYDARALTANGEFTPELQALMIQTAAQVRRQLAAQSQN